MMDYYEILKHYKNDLPEDCSLVDEALATLEAQFSYMNKDDLMHRSRPLAIAYLALKDIENKESEYESLKKRLYEAADLNYWSFKNLYACRAWKFHDRYLTLLRIIVKCGLYEDYITNHRGEPYAGRKDSRKGKKNEQH